MKKGFVILLALALILLLGVYFYILRGPNMGLPDFNYPADKVTQVYIVDKDGKSIQLNKTKEGNWLVNKKYEANEELMGRLLDDIHNQEAIGKVSKSMRKDIKRNLESHYVKVKVFNKEEAVLEYYIGRADESNRGNYMSMPPLREIFDVQNPSNPHNMLYDYSTILNEWRSIWLIDYSSDDIKKVAISYVDTPFHSFVLTNNAPNYTLEGKPKIEAPLNTKRVTEYLTFFTKVSSVLIAHDGTDREEVLAPNNKYASLLLHLKDGTTQTYEVYYYPITYDSKNYELGGTDKYDSDLLYVYTPKDGELYVVTQEVFTKLLRFYPEFYHITPN